MSERDPDQIRREIEATRRDLSTNVNELSQSVAPGNIVERQKRAIGDKARSLKESIMGSDDDYGYGYSAYDSSGSALDSAKQSAQNVADGAREVPQQIKRQTRGNPMAAGLVALGAGWLLGSLLPASREERRAAEAVKQKAQPLMEDAKEQAREMGENLKPAAQDAVDQVKGDAQQAVDHVKQDGQYAAEHVKQSAEQSRDSVQGHAQQARDQIQNS